MDTVISAPAFAAVWLVCMIIIMEFGRRVGIRQQAKEPGKEMAGIDMMGGTVFTLCGLLIAFTLTGAASRYDDRRMLIADEANEIGTAYMRIDLLADSSQPEIRRLFYHYVDSRLEVYRRLPDLNAARAQLAESEKMQWEIWNKAITATKGPGAHPDAAKLLLPSINSMIDITSTRLMAARIHPPLIMYVLLFILGLGCALVAGIRMADAKRRSWLHIFVFALVMSASVYVILALEYPRMSFINLGEYDQVLVQLRDSMK